MDVVYALKLAPKHVNFALLREKFCTVNAKCGAAKVFGLHLGFSSLNLSSHTSTYLIFTIFNYNTIANYI